MSWEESMSTSPCPCGKSTVTHVHRENDWFQTESYDIYQCSDCKKAWALAEQARLDRRKLLQEQWEAQRLRDWPIACVRCNARPGMSCKHVGRNLVEDERKRARRREIRDKRMRQHAWSVQFRKNMVLWNMIDSHCRILSWSHEVYEIEMALPHHMIPKRTWERVPRDYASRMTDQEGRLLVVKVGFSRDVQQRACFLQEQYGCGDVEIVGRAPCPCELKFMRQTPKGVRLYRCEGEIREHERRGQERLFGEFFLKEDYRVTGSIKSA